MMPGLFDFLLPLLGTLAVFGLAILGLAIGMIVHGRSLNGSCGGCTNCLVKAVNKYE